MTAQILDGKKIADDLIADLKEQLLQNPNDNRAPALAVVLVGDNAASAIYVRNKQRACEAAGIRSLSHTLPASTSEETLLNLVKQLNANPGVDGILVQLPLPPQINPQTIIENIDPTKDVDGFHPYNIGRLALRMPGLRPCTPRGVMVLLNSTNEPLKGKNAVVVGASNIVGRPMALELLDAGCTVTVCHSATRNLQKHVESAEILVVAVGRPNLIKGEWISEGAIVIDVGMNRLPDGKLCGDVEYFEALKRASWITPVPGGVGPLTVATLISNTVSAWKEHIRLLK